jgi:hypothetical protein
MWRPRTKAPGFGASMWDHVDVPSALPPGLVRQSLRFQVNRAEMMFIEAKARESGMSVANYVRAKLGFPERGAGRPTRAQLEQEQDQAWQLLVSIGVDPKQYFPDDESWLDSYR